MRRLAVISLFALCGCSYVQFAVPGGRVDLGSPRNSTVGVMIRPPANEPLEEEPEDKDKDKAPPAQTAATDATPAP